MDVQSIVEQLREELAKIENAIEALVGVGSQRRRGPGRPAGSKNAAPMPTHKRRTMSPAARKRISAAMKKRWAERRGKTVLKKTTSPAKKAVVRRPMSPAAKKKLSALMKARWAAAKKAGKNL